MLCFFPPVPQADGVEGLADIGLHPTVYDFRGPLEDTKNMEIRNVSV